MTEVVLFEIFWIEFITYPTVSVFIYLRKTMYVLFVCNTRRNLFELIFYNNTNAIQTNIDILTKTFETESTRYFESFVLVRFESLLADVGSKSIVIVVYETVIVLFDFFGYEVPGYEAPGYEFPGYEVPSYEIPGYADRGTSESVSSSSGY